MPLKHRWDLSPQQAMELQRQLRGHLRLEPLPAEIHSVGGVDVGFPRSEGVARAAAVVLAYPSLQLIEQVVAQVPLSFPYLPGLLSFRETPAILAALERLDHRPDVVLCDGHGLAHPRRFGLACHVGVLLDRPTIGCAKSILVGEPAALDFRRGGRAPLIDAGEVVGMAVRTRTAVRPVFVSVGHRVDLPTAVELVLACGRGYRLPEPIRLADQLV